MKTKMFILGCLMGCLLAFFIEDKNDYKSKVIANTKKNQLISMNLEQNAGMKDYKEVTQSNWPTEGYVFNKERSGCEKGGELSWDDAKKTVVMMGAVSDKCYVYFDKVSIKSLADYVKSQYTGIQGENNIYYHDKTLENGAGDNSYRYAGASEEVNNFVCFGSNADTCPDDNLYRIIGVIDGKVKLIKYDYATATLLGFDGDYSDSATPTSTTYKGKLTKVYYYYWNYKADLTHASVKTRLWSNSLLNETNLNTNFLNKISVSWANRIATTTWIVGGNTSTNIISAVPSVAYQNEIVNPEVGSTPATSTTSYSAKIGLMYVSDYGFAASPSAWTTSLSYYNDNSITSVNWMYMGLYEWPITRNTDNSGNVFYVKYDGGTTSYTMTTKFVCLRPCFNLESTVLYKSGTGTITDPFIIGD